MRSDQGADPPIVDAEFEVIKGPDQLPEPASKPMTADESVPWWVPLAVIAAIAGKSLMGGQ